jgi:hypothetical protein
VIVFGVYVGVRVLLALDRPFRTQPHLDYRYGLTFEGLAPIFIPLNVKVSNPGSLSFAIHLRNFSPGPLDYQVESVDIRLGTRTIPKYKANSTTGYMARGSARVVRPPFFDADTLKEFHGKGDTKGTIDFAITYGPPDEPAVRRLKLGLEIVVSFPESGIGDHGWSDAIISEDDETMNRSATLNRFREDVRVEPVVATELEFGHVQRHIFPAHFVERADDATRRQGWPRSAKWTLRYQQSGR